MDDASVGTIHGQGIEADVFREVERIGVRPQECGPRCVQAALVVHRKSVAAPMRFFFEKEYVATLQLIGGREPADSAAHNHHIMFC